MESLLTHPVEKKDTEIIASGKDNIENSINSSIEQEDNDQVEPKEPLLFDTIKDNQMQVVEMQTK
jgi:hypothetical protein